MFSGIIRHTGTIAAQSAGALGISSPLFDASVRPGDSIAVAGACLTVTKVNDGIGHFELMSETLRKTTLGGLQAGRRVNLERSLRFGDPVDGHFVQGHVDAVSTILSRNAEDEKTLKFRIALPAELKKFIAPKGSIAVEGVSLTIGDVDTESFAIYLTPYSVQETTLGQLQVGDPVNLEADSLARYVARILG